MCDRERERQREYMKQREVWKVLKSLDILWELC